MFIMLFCQDNILADCLIGSDLSDIPARANARTATGRSCNQQGKDTVSTGWLQYSESFPTVPPIILRESTSAVATVAVARDLVRKGTVILWLQLQPRPHDNTLSPRAPGHPSVLNRSTVADVSVWHRTGWRCIHGLGRWDLQSQSSTHSTTPIAPGIPDRSGFPVGSINRIRGGLSGNQSLLSFLKLNSIRICH